MNRPAPRWDVLAVVAVGGVLGSLARWAVGLGLPHTGRQFPWATFAVNVAGCLLVGALMHAEERRWSPSRYRRVFWRTGVLGGFTTFSAYGLDTQALLLAGEFPTAVTYVLATLLVGLAAVRVGDRLVALAGRGGRAGPAGPGGAGGRGEPGRC